MNDKIQILFVDDDPNVLSGLRRMLRSCRHHWQMHFAASGAEASKLIAKQPLDVIISDMKMPEVDGATLLTAASRSNPEIVRIVLSGQAEHDKIIEVVSVAHQFLSKPCESEHLQEVINNICKLQQNLGSRELRGIVTQVQGVPSLPENYTALAAAFAEGESAFDLIRTIVAGDIGLSAKVIQLVSSSFFGTPTPKCTAKIACDLLGFDLLSRLFHESDVFQPMSSETIGSMSFADLYNHSQQVARLAAEIARSIDCSEEATAIAQNAGLFHDIGRLILARHFPERFVDALKLSDKESLPLATAESQTFGSTHTALGSFLLSLWGVDPEVVAIVCNFRDFDQLDQDIVRPATAVYAANFLVNEKLGKSQVNSLESSPHLQNVGCIDRIPQWRSLAEGASA